MHVESQPTVLDMQRVQRLSRSSPFGCQRRLNSGPVASRQDRRVELGLEDMESDTLILRSRHRTTSESDIGNHKGLVSRHLLAHLLQQEHVRLVDSFRSSPLRIGNVQVQSHRVSSLPVEIDLVPVRRKHWPYGVRDADRLHGFDGHTCLFRDEPSAQFFVLFACTACLRPVSTALTSTHHQGASLIRRAPSGASGVRRSATPFAQTTLLP